MYLVTLLIRVKPLSSESAILKETKAYVASLFSFSVGISG